MNVVLYMKITFVNSDYPFKKASSEPGNLCPQSQH